MNMNLFKDIIEDHSEAFLKQVQLLVSKSIWNKPPHYADFQLLDIANDDYRQYRHFEEVLEGKVRDDLINPILFDLFKVAHIHCLWPEFEVKRPSVSNERIEQLHIRPFEFIIYGENARIGYRYSELEINDNQRDELLEDYEIDDIEVIDWSRDDSGRDFDKKASKWRTEIVQSKHIHVKQLFSVYFSDELYQFFIKALHRAVSEANSIIGFETIPKLSLHHLPDFEESVAELLLEYRTPSCGYIAKKDSKKALSAISKEGIDEINFRFFDSGLYLAMIGSSDFAKCFITAEYMYSIFNKGGSFDLATVVTGYFKATELLAYLLINMTLEKGDPENVWIKMRGSMNKYNKKFAEKRAPFGFDSKSLHVPLCSDCKWYFDTTLNSLFNALHDNAVAWDVKEEDRHQILETLRAYASDDRNGYVHKDVIDGNTEDGIKEVERIRHNTIFVAVLLIGGYVLSENLNENKAMLGMKDSSFNLVYEQLTSPPRSVNKFSLEFENGHKINVIRLRNQDRKHTNAQGIVGSSLVFVKTDYYSKQYEENHALIPEDHKVIVNSENRPTHAWVTKYNGEQLSLF